MKGRWVGVRRREYSVGILESVGSSIVVGSLLKIFEFRGYE